MQDARRKRIDEATRSCLDQCYGADNPLVQALGCLDRLRRDPRWDASEISEVESLVLSGVRVIVRQPRDNCCHEQRRSSPARGITRR